MIWFIILLCLVAALWLFLAISPWSRWGYSHPLNSGTMVPAPAVDWPSIGVIVPARNEGQMLPRTIPTICGQEYPKLQVVVVNDQSDDDSAEVLGTPARRW